MDLFIIRHGQSANNALPNIRDREVDPTLTDLGKRQAEILAEHLAGGETHDLSAGSTTGNAKVQLRRGFGITTLFTSPMYRSLQTVRPIGQSLGLAPQVWIDIHEEGGMYLDHGGDEGLVGYPGRTRSEILAEFPDYQLPPGISETGWWNRGHEDQASLANRATRVWDQLREMAAREDRVAMVTHGLFMDVLLKAIFGQLPGENIYYRHHNTAITRLSINAGERVEVRYVNRFDHLDAELVS
ncbi:MAG: histidine phosphatase family protein [Chloroflexi bacterium]|nr:histidine phosphatase family protein [Chloroflexota bacterium]